MSREAKFDKVAIGEININFLGGPTPVMTAKSRLVDTKTGQSLGSTTVQSWSPSILLKLKELRAEMEKEIEQHIFTGEVEETKPSGLEVTGIGERFNQDNTPSV